MSMNEKVPIVIAGRNFEVEIEGLLPVSYDIQMVYHFRLFKGALDN